MAQYYTKYSDFQSAFLKTSKVPQNNSELSEEYKKRRVIRKKIEGKRAEETIGSILPGVLSGGVKREGKSYFKKQFSSSHSY